MILRFIVSYTLKLVFSISDFRMDDSQLQQRSLISSNQDFNNIAMSSGSSINNYSSMPASMASANPRNFNSFQNAGTSGLQSTSVTENIQTSADIGYCIVCKFYTSDLSKHMHLHSKDDLVSALMDSNSTLPSSKGVPAQNFPASDIFPNIGTKASPKIEPTLIVDPNSPQIKAVNSPTLTFINGALQNYNMSIDNQNIIQPMTDPMQSTHRPPTIINKLPATQFNNQINYRSPLLVPKQNIILQQPQQPQTIHQRMPMVISQLNQPISWGQNTSGSHTTTNNSGQPMSFLVVNSNKSHAAQSPFPVTPNNGNRQTFLSPSPRVQLLQPPPVTPSPAPSPKIVLIGNGVLSNDNKSIVLTNPSNIQGNGTINTRFLVQGNPRLPVGTSSVNNQQHQITNPQFVNSFPIVGQGMPIKHSPVIYNDNSNNNLTPVYTPNPAGETPTQIAQQTTVQVGSNITISVPKDMANKKERLQQIINEELVRGIILNDTKKEGDQSINKQEEEIVTECPDMNSTLLEDPLNDVSFESNPSEENIGVGDSSFLSKIPETEFILIKEEEMQNIAGPSIITSEPSTPLTRKSNNINLVKNRNLTNIQKPKDDEGDNKCVTSFRDLIRDHSVEEGALTSRRDGQTSGRENSFPSGSSSFKVVEMTETCEGSQSQGMSMDAKVFILTGLGQESELGLYSNSNFCVVL